MTNNSTDFSKLRNDLIAKFEYIPKGPKYIPTVYKLIETNADVESIFIKSVGYLFNDKFNIVPNAVESVYNKILAANNINKLRKFITDISSSLSNDNPGDYEDLWFSIFKEIYEKQYNSVDKLKAALSMADFFRFCFDWIDEGYYEDADFINMKNEFIESVHIYYYKKCPNQ